ncbi:hypothetical protein BVX97_03035, partial [bacterium E08(2017)]
MKTLEQIESRTPISSLPFTITNSGSYYFVKNMTSTGHGVVVQTDHVDIDMCGFKIQGDYDFADKGLYLNGLTNDSIQSVRIHNGRVTGFGYACYAKNVESCVLQ